MWLWLSGGREANPSFRGACVLHFVSLFKLLLIR